MAPVPTPSPVQVLTHNITELQMKQVTNRRDSMSMDYHKGLLNMPGQNNCFLNSAVQVLWHLDIFRRSFRELSGHTCMAECCIFCALKELFTQLQYSQESALPPDALRHALAETFHQRRFRIGGMDDAAECFENILRQIHFHIANQESEDMCSSPHCIPHQKFSMALVEQAICNVCDATSEPLSFTQMVHYVSTSALCSQAEFLINQHKDPVDSFGHILRKAGGMGETRDCPGACGAKIQTSRILMNHPEIVSIGLVWDSERPSLEHILEVFKSIGIVLKIQEMFHSVVDNQWASNTTHHLVGIVTYYGKHYSTFFFHTKLGIWIYFDDATVHEIGPKWEQVIEKCRRGHFQPLLLLYANKNGSPVSGSTAPKSIIMVGKNHKSLKGSGHFHTGVIVSKAETSICNTVSDISQIKRQILSWEYPYQNGGSIQTKTSHEQNESILKSNLINCTLLHCGQCTMCSSQNLTMPSYYSNESRQQHLHQDCLSSSKCECGVPFHLSKCLQNSTGQQDLSHWININSSLHSSCVAESQGSVLSNHSLDNTSNHLTSNNFNESTLSDNTSKSNGWRQSCGLHLAVDESPSRSNIREFLLNIETKSQEASGLGNASENIIDCKTYINRKTVESVLNAQKLKRLRILNENSHSATGNRHSASSFESFDNIQARNTFNKMANLKGELGGTADVLRRRDSGNWSGDCNSGSSCSSSTSDTPYVHADGNKKLATSNPIGHQNATDNSRSCQDNYMNVGILHDQGYDSFSLSSTDSYPSISGSPVSSDTQLIQIPKDLQTKLQVTGSLMSAGSEFRHLSGHKIKTKVLREDCDKVCAEADLLLMKSHEKEKEGDLVMAAMLSDSAAAKARAAMDAPYNNTQSLVSAKMKHSFCVMRSSNLHKRLNEPEVEERRKQKDLSILEGHHSWQSNQDSRQRSIDGSINRHSQQGSKDSLSINNNMNAFNLNRERTIKIYATLPKRGNKHKCSPKSKDENQVYRDFTEKQKQTIKTDVINQVTGQMTVISQMNNRKSVSKKVSSVKTTSEFKVQACKKQEISDYNILSTKPNVHNYSNRNKDYGKKTSPDKTWSWQLFPNTVAAKQPEDSFMQTSEQCNRKQHKVRRKLISGFFRRKNRSLPDLREGHGQRESITHLFDDCAVAQMSPPDCCQDCDVKKKSDSTLDNKAPQVSRGFHQPHCAFIKKNNYHQRSLVKVNPPQVEGVPFKPTCDLTNNHAQNNIDFPVVSPDHMLLFHSRNKSHFSLNRETQYVKLPFPFTHSVTTKLPPNQDNLKNEFQQHSVQTDIDPLLQQDSTVQVTNTFLGNFQARHNQMLQSSRQNKTTPDELLEKTTKKEGMKEVIDNALLSQSQTEKAYLQDLENKQFQMMQKTHPKEEANKLAETITSGNTYALSQRQTYMDFVDMEQNQIKLTSECCHSHADMKLNVQNLPNTDTSDESHSEVEEIKTCSVKDLTSKFEFVLNQKPVKEKIGKKINSTSNTPCYEDKDSFIEQNNLNSSTTESHLPEKTSVQRYLGVDAVQDTDTSIYSQNMFPDPLNKSIPLSSEVQNIHLDMDEDKKWKDSCSTNIVPFVDTCKDLQSSENVSQFSSESEQSKHLPDYVETQFSSISKQPKHPPDYETTIQRIGKLKHKTQMKTVDVEKNKTLSLSESVSNYPRTLIETQKNFTTLLLSDQKCNEIGTKSEQLKSSFLGGVSFKDLKSAVSLKKRPGSKKSVTFSEQVILVACADDEENEHLPNPLLERVYKQHLQEKSTISLVGPLIVNSAEHSCLKTDDNTSDNDLGQRILSAFDSYICNLCHQKTVSSPGVYCPDCSFYMSRFKAG